MSYGVPVICSKKAAVNFGRYVMSYENSQQFVDKIIILKKNKKLSNLMSKKSLSLVDNYKWNKVCKGYLKAIKISKILFSK